MSQFEAVQIIELTSGVLPRGMSLSQNPDITFVESDLPKMISRKQELARQVIGERPNLRFRAIDATAQPSQFPLDANYLNPRKPIVILCEGLLGYLTFEQKVR
jgi:O-methyltransferase involved in polyketide biosynthesis